MRAAADRGGRPDFWVSRPRLRSVGTAAIAALCLALNSQAFEWLEQRTLTHAFRVAHVRQFASGSKNISTIQPGSIMFLCRCAADLGSDAFRFVGYCEAVA